MRPVSEPIIPTFVFVALIPLTSSHRPLFRMLACGLHRCAMACHAGSCLPCPLPLLVSCACGRYGGPPRDAIERKNPSGSRNDLCRCHPRCPPPFSLFTPSHVFCCNDVDRTTREVPCQPNPRPPKCRKKCRQPSACSHSQPQHRCHFGPCKLCIQACGRDMACGHACAATCHDPPPDNHPLPPVFTPVWANGAQPSTSVSGGADLSGGPPRGGKKGKRRAEFPSLASATGSVGGGSGGRKTGSRVCPRCTVEEERPCGGLHTTALVPCFRGLAPCDATCSSPLVRDSHACLCV